MSQVNKLSYVDGKLGAPASGQQTTRILFNTIEAPGTTSSLSFFKNFQGLTNGQTNLTQNKLDSMESMVIKTITLSQYTTAGVLNIFGDVVQQTLSIIVGNQTVVKNLPIQFNQGANGQAFDRLHENAGAIADVLSLPTATVQTNMPCEIRLLTDIVIPPQVAFEVRIESNGAVYGNGAVVCALSGYGKIFSAGNSF
jgi:ssRNA-specific RNase YbeY (16S rRNA maturation enzyme)